MTDMLKLLLDAELRGEAKVSAADQERARMVQHALDDARARAASFEAGLAQLKQPYLQQAEARAEQAITDLTREYGERQNILRKQAAQREAAATEAALALLLGHSAGDA